MDSAFSEVLSVGDDALLVKLMDRSDPVIDQLTHELADIFIENGPDVVGIPMEVKREILVNLHDSTSSVELPEDWEGPSPDQLLLQLASAWEIDLQDFAK